MSDYLYGWEPLSLSKDWPLPMLEPAAVEMQHRILLSAESAGFLSFGFGRISMDIKWMWRWSADGTLSLFRSWTGFEIFRVQMRPVETVPGATEWEVASALVESDAQRFSTPFPALELESLLLGLAEWSEWTGEVPANRAAALRASRDPGAMATFAPALLAEQLSWQLPARLLSLQVGDRQVVPDEPALVVRAVPDGDALRLECDDRTVLWLQQAHDARVGRGRLRTESGGVLLWPSAGLLRELFVSALVVPAAWEQMGRDVRMYDLRGEEMNIGLLRPAEDPGSAVLDLHFEPATREASGRMTVRAATAEALNRPWPTEENRRQQIRTDASLDVQGSVAEVAALALEIARCPEIPAAWAQTTHPCNQIVRVQQDRPLINRHVPEAWAGSPTTAKVVFLSSNPSISDAGDATSGDVEENYPRPGWPDDQIIDFMIRRFGPARDGWPDWVVAERFLRQDGTYSPKPVAFWRRARTRATELLGYPADPAADYLMTEVVHCKSKKETGVASAAPLRADHYLDRVLRLSPASLVTVVGARSRDTLRELDVVPASYGAQGNPAWEDVRAAPLGGRPRLLVYLPHFVGMEPKQTYTARYGEKGRDLLRAVAEGELDHESVDWRAELQV